MSVYLFAFGSSFSVVNEVGNADILVIQTPRGFPTIFHLLSNFLSLTELGKC